MLTDEQNYLSTLTKEVIKVGYHVLRPFSADGKSTLVAERHTKSKAHKFTLYLYNDGQYNLYVESLNSDAYSLHDLNHMKSLLDDEVKALNYTGDLQAIKNE